MVIFLEDMSEIINTTFFCDYYISTIINFYFILLYINLYIYIYIYIFFFFILNTNFLYKI